MTDSTKTIKLVTLAYTLMFGAYFLISSNAEFLWYVLLLLVLITVIASSLPFTRLTPPMLWALSLWGFLHMLGGGISLNGEVLYRHMVWPVFTEGEFSILRFDQVVHLYGSATGTFILYFILKPMLRADAGMGRILFLALMAGLGIGAANETAEFIAFIMLPYTTVGDYTNTGLDMLANLCGVLAGVSYIYYRERAGSPARLESISLPDSRRQA